MVVYCLLLLLRDSVLTIRILLEAVWVPVCVCVVCICTSLSVCGLSVFLPGLYLSISMFMSVYLVDFLFLPINLHQQNMIAYTYTYSHGHTHCVRTEHSQAPAFRASISRELSVQETKIHSSWATRKVNIA